MSVSSRDIRLPGVLDGEYWFCINKDRKVTKWIMNNGVCYVNDL